MPKRVIDFDAMWGSDKLASCAAWAQAEYAWLYGLADASGCFEVTNLRVIWGRVAAIRANLTIERLEQVFAEFQDKGLMFVWEHEGKRYAHWTGSDVPGRLPAPSWRMRLERFAPPVPKQQLGEYMARFARGRAGMAGGGFRAETQRETGHPRENCKSEIGPMRQPQGGIGCVSGRQMSEERLLVTGRAENRGFEISNLRQSREPGECFVNLPADETEMPAPVAATMRDERSREGRDIAGENRLKGRLEETQAQDLDWNGNLKRSLNGICGMRREERREVSGGAPIWSRDTDREQRITRTAFCNSNATSNSTSNANSKASAQVSENATANSKADSTPNGGAGPSFQTELFSNAMQFGDRDAQTRIEMRGNSLTGPPPSLEGTSQAGVAGRDADRASDGKDVVRAAVREKICAGSDAVRSAKAFAWGDKELAVARELRVGQGPVCGPIGVKAEVIERDRKRQAERGGSRST